jgi:hypothetical protein
VLVCEGDLKGGRSETLRHGGADIAVVHWLSANAEPVAVFVGGGRIRSVPTSKRTVVYM